MAVARTNPDDSGAVVGGFKLLEMVGRGGMGAVYRAKSPSGDTVAVKILASNLVENEVQRKRFYQEAQMAMRLDHPNIVRAIEVGEDRGKHFFAMEFIDGESIGLRLKRTTRMSEQEAVDVMSYVAKALQLAHSEGIIHRDIKPDNIMLTGRGDVKVADLGLGKQLDNDMNLTKTGRGLGTPHYMAPEQFRDAKHADARCDVYSMAATLYTMVTGEVPFKGTGPLDAFIKKSRNEYIAPDELAPDLSPNVTQAIKLGMDPDPDRRPQSAAAFAEMLGSNRSGKARNNTAPPANAADSDPFWYLIYQDTTGESKKVKGVRAIIEKQLKERKIPLTAEASLSKKGPFIPLTQLREFQAIVDSLSVVNDNGANNKVRTAVDDVKQSRAEPKIPAIPVVKANTDKNKLILIGAAIVITILVALVFVLLIKK